jgi:polar amino acid transport system substrate-binding protein
MFETMRYLKINKYNLKNVFLLISLSLPSLLYAESSTLQKILKSKTLTVSVNQYYEPFYISDPKEGFPGLDVEVAKELADYLGVNLRVLPLKTFDEHATRLEKGDTQLAIAGISTSLDRFKRVNFTDPYLVTTPAGLVNRQILPPEPEGQIITSVPFRSLADLTSLSGVSFSVLSNSSNHNWLKNNYKKNPIYSYTDDITAINELKKNNVNVYVADAFKIQAFIQKEPSLKSSYLPLLGNVQEEHISMAVQKGDLEFIHTVNFFIKENRRNGRMNSLVNKYFASRDWIKN